MNYEDSAEQANDENYNSDPIIDVVSVPPALDAFCHGVEVSFHVINHQMAAIV